MLKSVMKNKLPKEIINRKKQGFEVPLREWFKDQEFENVLNATQPLSVLNEPMVKKLVEENNKGQFDHGTLLWRILLLQRWMGKISV